MSRRKTVRPNLLVLNPLIKKQCRSNVVFCEKMGRANNWVTDWNRRGKDGSPAPKNLPSPEEAARMCVLLQTTPEEILMHEGATEKETEKCQKDIALVRSLIEQEKAKSNEKPPADDERFLPLAERREALSKAGIHILLDADAKVTEDQLDDIISFIEIQQRRNGR